MSKQDNKIPENFTVERRSDGNYYLVPKPKKKPFTIEQYAWHDRSVSEDSHINQVDSFPSEQ